MLKKTPASQFRVSEISPERFKEIWVMIEKGNVFLDRTSAKNCIVYLEQASDTECYIDSGRLMIQQGDAAKVKSILIQVPEGKDLPTVFTVIGKGNLEADGINGQTLYACLLKGDMKIKNCTFSKATLIAEKGKTTLKKSDIKTAAVLKKSVQQKDSGIKLSYNPKTKSSSAEEKKASEN